MNKQPNPNYVIKLDGVKLNPSKNVRYLGVLLDNELKWSTHVAQLKMKLNRAIGILSKLRYNLPLATLKMVYHSIFSSHILYGIQVWSQNSQTIKTKIQSLQDRAIRKITFSSTNCNQDDLYKNLKILKFQDLIYAQNCIFMSRVEEGRLPTSFSQQFSHRRDVHQYNTRASSSNLINIPNVRTNFFGTLSTTYKCISDWNNFLSKYSKQLPENLQSSQIRKFISPLFLEKY